ncbi:MAG TPA: monovalent cation/H+ antiporter subunit D [Burkholderiaceae bacterium]|nr:monovalent cation/H+ antiporter subunit D [Burkholderiaceae bacterium]
MNWPHWTVVPVVLPLIAGATCLLLERRAPNVVRAVSLGTTVALLGVALHLAGVAASGTVHSYLLGNWKAPFGIALALDRLSALMLVLTAVVAIGSALYARGGGARGPHDARGLHYHALFQFQLMGLNGAFLTADLFNLFVFFEVLLIASYGLLLHGGGAARLKAAIHYVGFNLTGSALFLVAVALLYGITGTLNMADLSQRVAALGPDQAALVRAAALLLIVVFGVKAALLPLYFWLPDTYRAAPAPVAALFAIMTKVGVYCVARVTTLIFGDGAGVAAGIADAWLAWLAIGTLALAALGTLAAVRLRTLVSYLVIASAGTLLLAIGLGSAATLSAALFYLVNSTLVAAALFLLVDSIASGRGEADDAMFPAPLAYRAAYGALFFVFALEAAGLPPMGGFIGKALLLRASTDQPLMVATWAALLVSGLGMMVAVARAGSTVFWKAVDANRMQSAAARPTRAERIAIGWLTITMLGVVANAGAMMRYAEATAAQLLDRRAYVGAVLGAQPEPPAWTPRAGMTKP